VEGLLRLRTLAGDALDVTLLAPNDELRYRPLAVDEPFAKRGVTRYARLRDAPAPSGTKAPRSGSTLRGRWCTRMVAKNCPTTRS
jgi:hypothetical protein